MKLVVDENILLAEKAFSLFGEVKLVSGREISPETLNDADILITRSVTKVDEALLGKSPVKFVGSATIGTDHLDLKYLESRNIRFANAPGCNSYSVAEYVFAALLELADKYNFKLKDKSLGVVGAGNIGKKVIRFADALGMKILKNDPPLERAGIGSGYSSLNEILSCDIITLHVPLNKGGKDNTVHLIGEQELSALNENSILINASRGQVVDNAALLDVLSRRNLRTVFDVWENEPAPQKELVGKVDIATPHIAGYSYDGKLNGTKMVFEALNNFLSANYIFPFQNKSEKKILNCSRFFAAEDVLRCAFRQAYKILNDDKNFRSIFRNEKEIGKKFDELRKNYHKREEFCNFAVTVNEKSSELSKALKTFRLTIPEQ